MTEFEVPGIPSHSQKSESPVERIHTDSETVPMIRHPNATRREIFVIGGSVISGIALTLLYGSLTNTDDQFSREVIAVDGALSKIRDDVDKKIMANGPVPLAPRGKLVLLQQLETKLNKVSMDSASIIVRAPVLDEKIQLLRHDMQESRRILGGF